LFKGIEIGPGRCDPIGLEGFQDEFNFSASDIRRREVKARERHEIKGEKVSGGGWQPRVAGGGKCLAHSEECL
jgi:hypothetical protein